MSTRRTGPFRIAIESDPADGPAAGTPVAGLAGLAEVYVIVDPEAGELVELALADLPGGPAFLAFGSHHDAFALLALVAAGARAAGRPGLPRYSVARLEVVVAEVIDHPGFDPGPAAPGRSEAPK